MPSQQARARVPANVLLFGPGNTMYSLFTGYAEYACPKQVVRSRTPGRGLHGTQSAFRPQGSGERSVFIAAVGFRGRPRFAPEMSGRPGPEVAAGWQRFNSPYLNGAASIKACMAETPGTILVSLAHTPNPDPNS